MATELRPCPFCGGTDIRKLVTLFDCDIRCGNCKASVYRANYKKRNSIRETMHEAEPEAVEAWNRRTPEIVKVETSFFDKEEIHENCTVQVLTNTATGEVSVGWWKNREREK